MPHDATADLLELLAQRRGVDFQDHRRETIDRGIASRLKATGVPEIDRYTAMVEQDDVETDLLMRALVVPVSSFFRDREVFAALERTVIPQQLADTAGALRTWVAGAATGEEAWSWAMLMAACRARCGGPPFEIIASDIDKASLRSARTGRYPLAASNQVPERFRQRFLCASGDQLIVSEELRRRVIFAEHDLMGPALAPAEAILASFRIISFRNVLIHLDRQLQRRALERLRSLLRPRGVLVLGAVETLPADLQASFIPYPGTLPALHIFRRVR
jgi:two-component system CheB/CheR fusion protein